MEADGMRPRVGSLALVLLITALLLNVGTAAAHDFSITGTTKKDGWSAGGFALHNSGAGTWMFTIDFTPDLSAERLFVELYVGGVEVYSIALCTTEQDARGLCYPADFKKTYNTLIPDITITSPDLPKGKYRINVFSDDFRGDGILHQVTVSITHPPL